MKKIVLLSVMFLLLSTGLPVSGEVPWEVGDKYTYTAYYEGAFTVEEDIRDDIGYSSSGTTEKTREFLINEINETAKTVSYDVLDTQGGRYDLTTSYNATEIGANFGNFGAWLSEYDNKSGYYIRDIFFISPFIDIPILVEPEFEQINKAFADTLNTSRVVYSYYDLNLMRYIDLTLGDFLGNMTFWSIQGQQNIPDAKDALDSGQKSYVMEFDLSGVAVTRYNEFNGTHYIYKYIVYDTFKNIYRWDYQSNGELNSYSFDIRSSYVRDNATVSQYDVYEIKQGGNAANNTNLGGFELVTALGSLFILPVLIRRKKSASISE